MKIKNSVVYPLITPFKENGDIDIVGIKKYVDYLISQKVKMIITTVGTSRFNLLENSEINEVNQKLIESADSRSSILCAGPIYGSTKVNLHLLKESISNGADGYLAIYPERFYEENSIIKFYFDLAEKSSIPIFIHQMSLRSGYGGYVSYTENLISRLMNHENILGMKEESQNKKISNWIHQNFSNEKIIIGQGGMVNFLHDVEYGAKSYLAGLGSFLPSIEEKFYKYTIEGKISKAIDIKENYEDIYFDFAIDLGWHIQLKKILSFMNLMNDYERFPLEPLSENNTKKLRDFLENHKFLYPEIKESII